MAELSILAAAREAPARDCLITVERSYSYGQVAERVRPAMQALRALELPEAARVGIRPSLDLSSLLWLYALFELGHPAVLIHPRLSESEQAQLLARARVAHLIEGPVPAGAASLSPWAPVPSERSLAMVQSTGTSGSARTAVLSRRAFLASARAHQANLGWRDDDRWLLCMPLAHIGGLSIVTRCLIARSCCVIASDPSGRFEAAQLIEALSTHRVTLLSLVPTMLRRMLDNEHPRWTPDRALRAVLVGGAAWPMSQRERARERGVPALATYGCTEACSQISTQTLEQSGCTGSGAPLAGVQVRIEDSEIQVKGETLMDGYLEADDPFTSDGWLHTGDGGAFLEDGQLEVRGRLDDLIISGGENVAPQEVEAFLETLPGVRAACVFGMPSEEWGQELVAVLVVDEAHERAAFFEQTRRGLAPHKRPKRICLVDSLPLNRSGKLDRAAVRARYGSAVT